jgi:hypothetical protein
MSEETKADYLRSRGWYTLWSEDNWLDGSQTYSNPDWAGMTTDAAYIQAKKKDLRGLK